MFSLGSDVQSCCCRRVMIVRSSRALAFAANFWWVSVLVSVAAAQTSRTPDPRTMLEAVIRSRQQLTSGEIIMDEDYYQFDQPKSDTDHARLIIDFSDRNLRVERVSRERRYELVGTEAAKLSEEKLKELNGDFGAFVRLGLGSYYDSRSIVTYGGSTSLDYEETSQGYPRLQISDPHRRESVSGFDPRLLGLNSWISFRYTFESSLHLDTAKSIQLVGQETIQGYPCWHLSIQASVNVGEVDVWLDINQPTRVRRYRQGDNTLIDCRYDENSSPNDPLPIETVLTDLHKGEPRYEIRLLLRKTDRKVSFPSETWTAAGLGMAVGTEVLDLRISRRIGYWDGSAITEGYVAAPKSSTATGLELSSARLLELIQKDPSSPLAREAACWVVLRSGIERDVNRAVDTLLRFHAKSPNFGEFCQELEESHYPSTLRLLRGILAANSQPDVQLYGSFSLAEMLKRRGNSEVADQKKHSDDLTEAEHLFERVSAERSQSDPKITELVKRASSELADFHALGAGQPAPDIVGEDIDGQKLQLSSYRGKVVVLVFWGTWCGPCMKMVPAERKLFEANQGESFAILGVDADVDKGKVKTVMAKEKMTWPSFWDGRIGGPIAGAWSVHSWPAVWVIDRKGTIRYRDLSEEELAQAVTLLMAE